MNNQFKFGFKIDNCTEEENLIELEQYIAFCNINNITTPIELGFECFGYKEKFLKKGQRSLILDSNIINTIKSNNFDNLVIHLAVSNKLLNIKDIDKDIWLDNWKKQIEVAETLKPKYFVIHGTSKERKQNPENIVFENMKKNWNILKSLTDIPFYIENTYEDLAFYNRFFDYLDDPDLNFVLDIGHIKIHSKEIHDDIIQIMLDFAKTRKIHFHIHDNNALQDQHEPISKNENKDTIDFIHRLVKNHSNSIFILENRFGFDAFSKDFNLFESL